MKTNNISETAILKILSSNSQITWDEFFKLFPGVINGGDPAKAFGNIIHHLLKMNFIATTTIATYPRYWKITDLGKQYLDRI